MHLLNSIIAITLSLGTIEGVAYWWMHPAPAGQGEPVLVYRPSEVDAEKLKTEMLNAVEALAPIKNGEAHTSLAGGKEEAAAPSFSPDQKSAINNPQSSISPSSPISASQPFSVSASTLTLLPEIYAASAPMLRCSSGQVLHAKLDDTAGIHLAFFEWDGTDTGSVLEAFRHMPEACMGSIGLKLIEKAPARTYVVGRQGTGDWGHGAGGGNQKTEIGGQGLEVRDPEEGTAQSTSSNSTSNIQNSKLATQSLTFDHTVFREGGGPAGLGAPIHAFRAVWVSGMDGADARKGLDGNEFDRLRTIRFNSALHRFRPAHARVIQGAIRGIPDPDLAWQAFEQTMLKDLSFVAR